MLADLLLLMGHSAAILVDADGRVERVVCRDDYTRDFQPVEACR